MKIGVMSDIHDHIKNLIKAIEIFNTNKCDLVICCGDWGSPNAPNFLSDLNCKTISVFGNNDADIFNFLTRKQEKNWNIDFHKNCAELELDAKKIVVYHGDSEAILDALIKCNKYDIVFSGHNHKAEIKQINNTLHINPGSITNIRVENINHNSSIAIYDTNTNKGEIINIKG
jgi:hypothetical protein